MEEKLLEVLEKLADSYEGTLAKVEEDNQLNEWPDGAIWILLALASASKKVGAIGKDKRNKDQNFDYRSIDAIMSGIHDALADNDIVITNSQYTKNQEERATRSWIKMYYKENVHTFTFWHKDWSCLKTTIVGSAMDMWDKTDNKCLSIALKYALTTLFLIPLQTDDPDGESHDTANSKKKSEQITEDQKTKIGARRSDFRKMLVDSGEVDENGALKFTTEGEAEWLKTLLNHYFKKNDLNWLTKSEWTTVLSKVEDRIQKHQSKTPSEKAPEKVVSDIENGKPEEQAKVPGETPSKKTEGQEMDEFHKEIMQGDVWIEEDKTQKNIDRLKSMKPKTVDEDATTEEFPF